MLKVGRLGSVHIGHMSLKWADLLDWSLYLYRPRVLYVLKMDRHTRLEIVYISFIWHTSLKWADIQGRSQSI